MKPLRKEDVSDEKEDNKRTGSRQLKMMIDAVFKMFEHRTWQEKKNLEGNFAREEMIRIEPPVRLSNLKCKIKLAAILILHLIREVKVPKMKLRTGSGELRHFVINL